MIVRKYIVIIYIDIKDFDDLKAEISANPTTFSKMLEATYYFKESSIFSKMLITKSLNKEENDLLLNIVPSHNIDIQEYNREVNIGDLIDNSLYLKKYFEYVMSINFSDGVILDNINFIRELNVIDRDNTDKLLSKIILIDLEICKYLINIFDDKVVKEHINIYENSSIIGTINYILDNELFFKEVLSHIIDVCINKKFNNIDIDYDFVKKLKIN